MVSVSFRYACAVPTLLSSGCPCAEAHAQLTDRRARTCELGLRAVALATLLNCTVPHAVHGDGRMLTFRLLCLSTINTEEPDTLQAAQVL